MLWQEILRSRAKSRAHPSPASGTLLNASAYKVQLFFLFCSPQLASVCDSMKQMPSAAVDHLLPMRTAPIQALQLASQKIANAQKRKLLFRAFIGKLFENCF